MRRRCDNITYRGWPIAPEACADGSDDLFDICDEAYEDDMFINTGALSLGRGPDDSKIIESSRYVIPHWLREMLMDAQLL